MLGPSFGMGSWLTPRNGVNHDQGTGLSVPIFDSILTYMCYHTKFRCSKSNCLGLSRRRRRPVPSSKRVGGEHSMMPSVIVLRDADCRVDLYTGPVSNVLCPSPSLSSSKCRWSAFSSVHPLHPYVAIGHTRLFSSQTLIVLVISRAFQIFDSDCTALLPMPSLSLCPFHTLRSLEM